MKKAELAMVLAGMVLGGGMLPPAWVAGDFRLHRLHATPKQIGLPFPRPTERPCQTFR